MALKRLHAHHGKSPVHREATNRSIDFKARIEKKSTPIDLQFNKIKKEQIEENRKRLKFIVEAVILCGRQNIALRCHRDDTKDQLAGEVNPGSFIEILKYGVRCAGILFEDFVKNMPANAHYRSKTIQNQIIEICGELLTNEIVNEIKEARFFSILLMKLRIAQILSRCQL